MLKEMHKVFDETGGNIKNDVRQAEGHTMYYFIILTLSLLQVGNSKNAVLNFNFCVGRPYDLRTGQWN